MAYTPCEKLIRLILDNAPERGQTLSTMKITYTDDEAFYNGIENLVQKGLHFEADHNDLTISLTGAY